jgi:NADPH:quinone reductase-like Zn-dependent oxidoreductase
MKAIKILPDQQAGLQDVPVPKLRHGYVLCKVKCVALNPTDWYVQVNDERLFYGSGTDC